MGFEVFHTDTHALHTRHVDFRYIHRLETGNRDLLFHFCELFGRIDAVVFEQLRIEVDLMSFSSTLSAMMKISEIPVLQGLATAP